MGAKIASFLATLILSIPLAAIGLMAVFGIPQLVPANGDSSDAKSTVIRNVQDAFHWGKSEKNSDITAHAHADDAPEFGMESHSHQKIPQMGSRPAMEPATASSAFSSFDSPRRDLSSTQEPDSAPRNATGNGQMPRHWSEIPSMSNDQPLRSDSSGEAAGNYSNPAFNSSASMTRQNHQNAPINLQGPQLTWRQASSRLNELGVKNYHLERGAAEGTFLFVCVFSPGDAPHVVHRFEAEAEEPLLAVNQVLQQVDKWMQGRYASANFPSKPQSMAMPAGSRVR